MKKSILMPIKGQNHTIFVLRKCDFYIRLQCMHYNLRWWNEKRQTLSEAHLHSFNLQDSNESQICVNVDVDSGH